MTHKEWYDLTMNFISTLPATIAAIGGAIAAIRAGRKADRSAEKTDALHAEIIAKKIEEKRPTINS